MDRMGEQVSIGEQKGGYGIKVQYRGGKMGYVQGGEWRMVESAGPAPRDETKRVQERIMVEQGL
jgi:hypothetical protein